MVLFEFAGFVAADEDFEHGAAATVDEVEGNGGFAHEWAFDEVDGGAVFVVDVAVDAALFSVVEVVETAADFAAGNFAGYFGDDVGES